MGKVYTDGAEVIGGGGAVDSFNSRTGAVVPVSGDYNADQITETASNKIMTSSERTKLAGVLPYGSNSKASTASLTPDSDANKLEAIRSLAANLTINAPSGTPVDGQSLIIRIEDNGTSRTLTWNAVYEVVGVTLPTATTISKKIYVGCIYNAANSVWDVVAVNQEA